MTNNYNLNLINMDKKQIAVLKRKATILKKREMKEQKKTIYQSKQIMKAGVAFTTEKDNVNDKFKIKDDVKGQRERRKFERKFETVSSAINNMFHTRTLNDVNSLNLMMKSNNNELIIIPNETFIKNRLATIFTNEITTNNKNLKISQFVTIKYLITEDLGTIDDEYFEMLENKTYDKKYFKEIYFNSEIEVLTSINKIDFIINNIIIKFMKNLEEMQKSGSGGVFAGIIKAEVKISKSKNILGGSYVELPLKIKNKQACVNIKNDDNKCFLWSLLAYKHYDEIKSKSKNEVRHYKKYIDSFKIPENSYFPVDIGQIHLWEETNNMKINVFILDESENIKNEYHSHIKNKNVCNLLLHNEHYVWIKNLDRFDSSNVSKNSVYRCSLCLSARFPTKEKLEAHIIKCIGDNELIPNVCLPTKEEDKIKKFTNYNREFLHPFHIVADFESTLLEVKDDNNNTQKYQKHVANSYGLKYNCIHKEYSKDIKIYNNSDPKNVIKNFVEDIESMAHDSYRLMKQNERKIKMNNEQKEKHEVCQLCEKCKCKFTDDNKKVKHHDHITGQYISTLCSKCNLNLKYNKMIPIYIHNLKGYDAHLFISGLFEYGQKQNEYINEDDNLDKNGLYKKVESNISCIPNNEERYISFSKKIKVDEYKKYDEVKKQEVTKNVLFEIRFIDTFAFMASGLESLANNLKKGCKSIDDMRKVFSNTSEYFKNDEQFELMTKKGIYPYDYITNFDKLHDTRLPYRKDFYNKLNNKECSEEDYNNAINVWRKFNCKSLLDYHNIYLISDVLLLTDIWENFRSVCYKNYGLDCEYYYTAPGLSWDAMLKFTEIELELLVDLDKYLFVESGIRGGISQISKRYAKANNKYMENYNPDLEESSIIYLDANNLYGYAMSTYLPYKNFEWNKDVWNVEKIMNLDNKAEIGYLFEVDLHLPKEKHDYFNNYALCPENISINKNELNEWQQENYNESKIKKLCLTLHDKIRYVVNYRYLKLALSLGYKLTHVNRVLQYNQCDFLAKYINKNTELRIKASNDFEKDFYKLMNNSVYGKTMENVRNRINFRLITTEEEALRVKNLKRFNIFNENLVGLHIVKTKVTLDKPIYLGQNILDDSKVLMTDFHYNFMLNKIERQDIDLLFTDTDSLCYHIRNHDIFKIIKENKEHFDLSNYPKDHELYDGINNKVIGKFKNESVKQITEFVGLRAKLYSFITEGDDDKHNKCKGVKRSVVENELDINHYKHTLNTREPKKISQNGIRSYNHEIFSETQIKTALSACDDKVFICSDNINTYSFGHHRIEIIQNFNELNNIY